MSAGSHVAFNVTELRTAATYYGPASAIEPLLLWAADEIERLGKSISDVTAQHDEAMAEFRYQSTEHGRALHRIDGLEMQLASREAVIAAYRTAKQSNDAYAIQLHEAAGWVLGSLGKLIAEGGGCDHSVGICWCHEIRWADRLSELLAKNPNGGAHESDIQRSPAKAAQDNDARGSDPARAGEVTLNERVPAHYCVHGVPPYIECPRCVAGSALTVNVQEDGPWKVGEYGAPYAWAIYSDDFHHDATLIVSGDFEDTTARLEYAKEIARRLNAASPRTGRSPSAEDVEQIKSDALEFAALMCDQEAAGWNEASTSPLRTPVGQASAINCHHAAMNCAARIRSRITRDVEPKMGEHDLEGIRTAMRMALDYNVAGAFNHSADVLREALGDVPSEEARPTAEDWDRFDPALGIPSGVKLP